VAAALKRAGIRARSLYQTRHTFATLALSSGEVIGWAERQPETMSLTQCGGQHLGNNDDGGPQHAL
jgi:integrase